MKTRIRIGTSVLVLAALGCVDESPTAPVSSHLRPAAAAASLGSWFARADYPRDIWNAASASVTDPSTLRTVVYVIGGSTAGGVGSVTSAVKAYDVRANVWRSRAPYPVRVYSTNGAVAIDGQVYVSGGVTRRWDEQRGVWRPLGLRSLYRYDPATDTWQRRRDMPFATAGGVSAVYKGVLYVVTDCADQAICGPWTGEGALWRYHPPTDRWTLIARTPHDRFGAGAGFIGGKLYVGAWELTLDIYDLTTNTWSAGPGIPAGSCGPIASATLQAKLYFVGCFKPDNFDPVTLVFDPKMGKWSEAPAPPEPWGAQTMSRVIVNGQPRLEVIGGAVPGNNWQSRP